MWFLQLCCILSTENMALDSSWGLSEGVHPLREFVFSHTPPTIANHTQCHTQHTHTHTPHKQTHLCNSGLVVTLLHNYVHTHSTCSVYITLHWRAPECNSPHMGHVIIMSTWLCLTSTMRWRHMIKWQWPVYQLCFPYISCSFIATPRRNLQ